MCMRPFKEPDSSMKRNRCVGHRSAHQPLGSTQHGPLVTIAPQE
jgi:hypothetical protein